MKIENGKKGVTTSRTGVWWTMPLLRQIYDVVKQDSSSDKVSLTPENLASVLSDLDMDMRPGKAFAKLLYTRYTIKLSPLSISEIGNIIMAVPEEPYTMLLTLGCEGTREEYFNERSCWWTTYPRARDILYFNGGGAVRAYKDDELVGRAWFLPHEDWIVLFNFYGLGCLQHAQAWLAAVSQAFNWTTQLQSVEFDCPQGELFVNSTMCVVAGVTDIPRIPMVRPNRDVPYHYSKKLFRCKNCGFSFPEEDVTYLDQVLTEPGYYCNTCIKHHQEIITAGTYVGQPCFDRSIIHIDDDIYFCGDDEIMVDADGIWCRCDEAINIEGYWFAPQSVVVDVYGTYHLRSANTWRLCVCNKVYPALDDHFSHCSVRRERERRAEGREIDADAELSSSIIYNWYTDTTDEE